MFSFLLFYLWLDFFKIVYTKCHIYHTILFETAWHYWKLSLHTKITICIAIYFHKRVRIKQFRNVLRKGRGRIKPQIGPLVFFLANRINFYINGKSKLRGNILMLNLWGFNRFLTVKGCKQNNLFFVINSVIKTCMLTSIW